MNVQLILWATTHTWLALVVSAVLLTCIYVMVRLHKRLISHSEK